MADDPFFADEDDDDFDDLYGNATPAPTPPRKGRGHPRGSESTGDGSLRSPAVSSRSSFPLKSQTTFADTPSDWSSSQQRPRPSASVTSSLGSEDKGSGKKAKARDKKARRKGSQELFDVEWQDEAHVPACSICASGFSLVRRKHHCRPCGRVMCSDCSSFLFFEASHRKHRVCSACAADHSAAARSARQPQGDTLFDSTSDSEPSSAAIATDTPSPATSEKRGGFRASVLHAITPNSGRRDLKKEEDKKAKKSGNASKNQRSTIPSSQRSEDAVSAANARDEGARPALFNSADDEWFAEPTDDGEKERKRVPASRMDRTFLDADYSDGLTDRADNKPRTAADEWSDQMKASYELQLDSTPRVEAAVPSGFGFRRNDFSEQFHYDDDPLEYDEYDKVRTEISDPSDFKPAMPRPDPVGSFPSRIEPTPSIESSSGVPPVRDEAPEDLRQSILKVNLKGLFQGKAKKEKRGRRKKSKGAERTDHASPRIEEKSPIAANAGARASTYPRMTLDELAVTPTPVTTGTSAVRSTFYDDNADELVVDDTPGYFEANMAKSSADRRKQEELQRKLAEDAAWINGATAPIPSRNRFSSEQESFSLVDAPSHGTSSPESGANITPSGDPTTHEGGESKEHGLTGALKRFFGMSTAKQSVKSPVPAGDELKSIKPVDPPVTSQASAPISDTVVSRKSIAENLDSYSQDRVLSFRHSLSDVAQVPVHDHQSEQDAAALRYTMTNNLDALGSMRPETFMVPGTQAATGHAQSKKKESSKSLKRRDTFDDLFASPKAVNRHNPASSAPPTRSWGDVPIQTTPAYSTGTSRFDAYRDDREDEVDDFMPSSAPVRVSDAYHSSSSDARYHSAPMLQSRHDSADVFDSPTKETGGFTWSSVQTAPGFGTASYAVPAGVPPRNSRFGGDRFAPNRADSDDGGADSSHNIMQDIHRRSESAVGGRKQSTADSVDDIFAQFERPNDYVFDAATGSYVPARPVPRASRREKKNPSASEWTDEPNDDVKSRSSVGRRSSEHIRGESAKEVKPVKHRPVERGGEDSESNESDDVIVDKISSLEGELAALKRLIKKRKGGSSNSSVSRSSSSKHEPRVSSISSAKPRKESIFDGSSSESDKEMPGSRWPNPSTRISKRETMKLQSRKARRDSFASLFDDDTVEDGSIAGAGGYDALFQIGSGKSDESDGDGKDKNRSPSARRSGTRKHSKKFQMKNPEPAERLALDDVGASDGDEAELSSLKDKRFISRRQRSSKERSAPSWSDDASDGAVAAGMASHIPETNASSIATSSSISTKAIAVDEEDSIDALFDSSNDAKMSDLYGGDTVTQEEQVERSDPAPEKETRHRLSARRSKTRRRLSDDDSDEDNSNTVPAAAPIAHDSTSRSNSALVNNGAALSPFPLSTSADSDSEEEFSINWKKVKSGRARRQTRASAAPAASVSFVAVTATDLASESDEVATSAADPAPESNETLSLSEETSARANDGSGEQVEAELLTQLPLVEVDRVRLSHDEGDEHPATVMQRESNSSLAVATDSSESVDAEERKDSITSANLPDTFEPSRMDADSTLLSSTTPSFMPLELHADLFKGEDGSDDRDASVNLFDRSDDVDLDSLIGGDTSTLYDDDLTPFKPDTSSPVGPSSSRGENNGDNVSSSGEEDNESTAFSFEIQPQRRRTTAKLSAAESTAPRSNSTASTATADEDDQGSVLLGKYAHTPSSRTESFSLDDSIQLGASFSSVDTSIGAEGRDSDGDAPRTTEDDGATPRMSADGSDAFNADWQAMQEQEKQRRKRLQMKQRQAQRDKLLLKKQHSKALVASSTDAAGDGKAGKKKKSRKKSSTRDDAAPSSRKHRHREKEERAPDGATAGSLTEL